MMTDLKTTLPGLDLEHPLLLASGPLSHCGEALIRAHDAGAAAVVTKTISREAAINPTPCIAHVDGGLINVERWSELPPERWIQREIPMAKDHGVPLIASLGLSVDDVRALAGDLERAGADALEVVSYTASELPEMVSAAATRVSIPVFAKISANWLDPAAIAEDCASRGAAAITAIDSIGPALRIDLETRRPVVGAAGGWWTGQAIFPISLSIVASVAKRVSVPVIATGGITHADHVLEALLAGASAVGLCTLPLIRGLGVFDSMRRALVRRMAALGMAGVSEIIGAARPPLAMKPGVGAMEWEASRCSGCGHCVSLCPYGGRTDPGTATGACRLCGLCVTLCPTGALRWKGETS